MVKAIKRLINNIKSEKNWHSRTSDAPKVFNIIRSYIATQETWNAKMSEHLRIRITKEAEYNEENTNHGSKSSELEVDYTNKYQN